MDSPRNRLCLGFMLALLLAWLPASGSAQNTGSIQGRVIDAATQAPVVGAQLSIVGTRIGVLSNTSGDFLIPGLPPGEHRVRVQYIGFTTLERTVRVAAGEIVRTDFGLSQTAISLDAVVVTSLGQTTKKRALGTAQQTVQGPTIAQAQKENFVNALQGRVAGLEVISNSGVPGASAQIIVRGISSISGNNSPLMIIDGLPVDNKVQHSNQLFPSQWENRGLDFTNRASDFNPEDIESLTVLKGPEAAALYGIDAANGAIVITTKRGKAGVGGFEYSNSIKVEVPDRVPATQHLYGPSTQGSSTWLFWGNPYPAGTRIYDNVSGFFQNAVTQKHNLSFSGASADSRINYRLAASTLQQQGVVPTGGYDRINVTASSQALATSWLQTDASIQYSTDQTKQPIKGAGGPLLGLLAWPDTIDARDWLTPEGTRKRITTLSAASEIDNPYFSTYRNRSTSRTNRINLNVGLTLSPISWASLKTNIGVDNYTQNMLVTRHPESAMGYSSGGILDQATDMTRNIASQTLLNFNRYAITDQLGISATVGNAINVQRSDVAGATGTQYLDPNFVSMNNTFNRSAVNRISQRRLVSAFGSATFDYRDYLYVTLSGRNDWTSTIPVDRRSFFYPGVNASFIFTDAFPSLGSFMTGKLRAGWAEVGKDARPYAYAPSLENKLTSYGGYGYGFTGPNPNLKPEFATSKELGTELSFLNGRLAVDATVYRKETRDQIVDNVRASYGSGYILINLNGAKTRSQGLELTLSGTPIQRRNISWDIQANFTKNSSTVLAMPSQLPEYYSSDTWIINNIRNGVTAGYSTLSLTGYWYLRNKNGDLLIDPTSGLPLRDSNFRQRSCPWEKDPKACAYDRQPDFLIGLTNSVRYKRLSLSALLDIRKGGDVVNGTEWYLTQRGLSKRTLDRQEPRIVAGVLRDGLENTDNPTKNTIVVVPAVNNSYYLSMSEELFIERDINWVRLRDVTLSYRLPEGIMGTRNASVFVTGTELFLITNYTGLDPIVNGNTAATGGGGGIGLDWGNFPMPMGINFGVRVGF